MGAFSLRKWQTEALVRWQESSHRGIISVVTGGGKTYFALACIATLNPDTTLIVVPTIALLDQWWEEASTFFGLELDEINIVTSHQTMKKGTINIAVLNTASHIVKSGWSHPCFLIVDECHKAASTKFQVALDIPKIASLGLSATPERQYDDGLNDILVPALGPVIYEYSYSDALKDGVIVDFNLKNVVFEMEEDVQKEYDRLTLSISRSISKYGIESEQSVALMLKRARVLNLSLNRIKITLKIIAANKGKKILVFHEDINACDLINKILIENKIKSGTYHSKIPLRNRVELLKMYRSGEIDVLVTCRALDEGFNVPETEIGIIAASTATRRQRIQRLGRILRPTNNKDRAIIYSLVSSGPEISRLQQEESDMEGIADVSWSKA